MIKIFISNYHDVYTNIAIERYLLMQSKDDLVLYLWSNNPCVVFGRNQNIYDEVNIDYAHDHHIDLIRRYSGGGAVYQDRGNLNYTFIYKDESNQDKINGYILKVFKNLGLDVSFSGRNDLLIDGKKFSGIAYCNDFDHIMYHGTCLIDVSLENLVDVLKPHDYKLISHSVKSYRSRVINLKEIKDISENDICESFIETLQSIDEVEIIDNIIINHDIQCLIDTLSDPNYIFNDCPGYTYQLDIKLNNSNYHFDIRYKDGIIDDVKIFSDDLDNLKKDCYYKKLINKKIPFSEIKEYLTK